MKDTIRELWYGNIDPMEKCGANDSELNELIGLMERNRNKLCEELNEKQKAVLEKYISCSDEYAFRSETLSFIEGFCLASRLWSEALMVS